MAIYSEFSLKIVVFHSYVSLPEGTPSWVTAWAIGTASGWCRTSQGCCSAFWAVGRSSREKRRVDFPKKIAMPKQQTSIEHRYIVKRYKKWKMRMWVASKKREAPPCISPPKTAQHPKKPSICASSGSAANTVRKKSQASWGEYPGLRPQAATWARPQNCATCADAQATCGRPGRDPRHGFGLSKSQQVDGGKGVASSKLSYSQSFSKIGSTEFPNSSTIINKPQRSLKALNSSNFATLRCLSLSKGSDA